MALSAYQKYFHFLLHIKIVDQESVFHRLNCTIRRSFSHRDYCETILQFHKI